MAEEQKPTSNDDNWPLYFEKTRNGAPRENLVRALDLFEKENLPTIGNPEQDGLVRLNEVTLFDDKNQWIFRSDLLPIE